MYLRVPPLSVVLRAGTALFIVEVWILVPKPAGARWRIVSEIHQLPGPPITQPFPATVSCERLQHDVPYIGLRITAGTTVNRQYTNRRYVSEAPRVRVKREPDII